MNEALSAVVRDKPGDAITVSVYALQGVNYMVADMNKEIEEALTILDF
jgi:hypothetical protein